MKDMTLAEYFAGTDTQLMILSAFRYALGSQTYIVGSHSDYIQAYRAYLTANTKHVIVRDIVEALMRGDVGSPTIDAPVWQRLGALLYREMGEAERASVRTAVAYMGESAIKTIWIDPDKEAEAAKVTERMFPRPKAEPNADCE